VALAALLQQPLAEPARQPDLAAWWPHWQALHLQARGSPLVLALQAGHAADRIGWAFAGGYQAALRALRPALWRSDAMAALCVTEATGNRPRDIRTRIVPQPGGGLKVAGAKRWTTLGPHSATLMVVGAWQPEAAAAEPAGEGRAQLRVLELDSRTPGITLQPMPATPFVPEVPHASVLLDDVSVPAAALLPGDGYTACVKPFRTVEDIHVSLAVGAYLLREARSRGWPPAFNERLLAALALLAVLSAAEPLAPATHLLLAGALQQLHAACAEAQALWPASDGDEAARRWRRDAALLQVAQSARTQRAQRAWQALQPG